MARKKINRIPLLLLPFGAMDEIGRRMRGLGRVLCAMRPNLKKELKGLEIDLDPDCYCVGAFFSALIYGVLFSIMSYVILLFSQSFAPELVARIPIAAGFGFFFIFFMLHLIYPSIIIKKVAIREDKDLLFALREIMLGVNSGVPLFDSLKNVSIGNYGYVSDDFTMVVKLIESGESEKEALKTLVLRTESEYLRRAIWQMVNALESGASMTTALPGIVDALENHTYRMIRSYSANLNFLMLIYMLIAAAIPSLGITFLVLLSAFSGFGVSVDKILGLIFGAAIGQVILIGYMGSTRPAIFGG
jgi:flagellar protein FlaJ